MKHERDIKPSRPAKWRLSRTLKRRMEFRPIEDEDMRFIWAGYKKGSLASMGGVFTTTDMAADQFHETFVAEVKSRYHAAWTLIAETPKGMIPIGFILAVNPGLPFMIIGDMIWFPWSRPRTRVESAVNFFHKIRSQFPMVEYASEKHKKFFEMIAQHGVMRRVGTTFNVYMNEPTAIFETRAP